MILRFQRMFWRAHQKSVNDSSPVLVKCFYRKKNWVQFFRTVWVTRKDIGPTLFDYSGAGDGGIKRFLTNVSFQYPRKHRRFFNVFRGSRKRLLAWNFYEFRKFSCPRQPCYHSVHRGINPPSKTPPPLSSPWLFTSALAYCRFP